MKKIIFFLIVIGFLISCSRDAEIVSHNLSYDADNFKVKRRIVFINGITDTYLFEIIGYCSIKKDNQDNQLEVTCKVGHEQYKKHYLGLSDNVFYMVEQIDPKTESKYNYKTVFKPQSIIPDIEVKVSDKRVAPLPKLNVENEK